MRWRRILGWLLAAAVALTVALAALAAVALSRHLNLPSLAELKMHARALAALSAAHPFRLRGLFVIICACFSALPLPGAELLVVAAGAMFGLVEGTLLAVLAVTLGSCGAFLIGRFLLHGGVRRHLQSRLTLLALGIEREGAFYLFALRMIPAIPFFVVNVAMGATSLGLATFAWVSAIGMLPAVAAYVNAGRAVGRLQSLSGILSPGILASLAVLGLLPLVTRRLILALHRRFRPG
ncbi:MAG TPA: VTT domain-containing protein [Acetobacteraceae bacterium]|nr:VTT domain-containing protein [Acetobacteraceae bacterium]